MNRIIFTGGQVFDGTGAPPVPADALGHIDPSFNPPLDVSFFRHMPTPDEHLAIAERNAKILLDHGFTSAYSRAPNTASTPRWRRRWAR